MPTSPIYANTSCSTAACCYGKKYMPIPPSPLSPCHAFNTHKYHHNLFSRMIRHAVTPTKSPKDQKIINTPNRESRNDDDEINNDEEYIETPKRIVIMIMITIMITNMKANLNLKMIKKRKLKSNLRKK